jgi:hypothetical protein
METVIVCGGAPTPAFIQSLIDENHTVLLLRDDLDIKAYACFEDTMEFSILLQSATANPMAVKTTIETVLPSTLYYVQQKQREIDIEQIVVKFIVRSIDKEIRPKFIEVR